MTAQSSGHSPKRPMSAIGVGGSLSGEEPTRPDRVRAAEPTLVGPFWCDVQNLALSNDMLRYGRSPADLGSISECNSPRRYFVSAPSVPSVLYRVKMGRRLYQRSQRWEIE